MHVRKKNKTVSLDDTLEDMLKTKNVPYIEIWTYQWNMFVFYAKVTET